MIISKSHFRHVTSVSKSVPSANHVFIVSIIPTAKAATSVKNVNHARVVLLVSQLNVRLMPSVLTDCTLCLPCVFAPDAEGCDKELVQV